MAVLPTELVPGIPHSIHSILHISRARILMRAFVTIYDNKIYIYSLNI